MDLNQFGLRPLSLPDKPFIDNILKSVKTELSAYSFITHYILKDMFQFYWGIIDDYFCLFAVYGDYIYMPITPVSMLSPSPGPSPAGGEGAKFIPSPLTERGEVEFQYSLPFKGRVRVGMGLISKEHYKKIISTVFSLMHKINNNPAISRIENIDESMKEVFLSMGYNLKAGESEYVYLREDLTNLKGNPFKSKRAMYNYFIKNYQYIYEPFLPGHAEDCIKVLEKWKEYRGRKPNDHMYHALLEDALYSHEQAITNYEALSLTGRIVRIDNRIEGYTFGFGRGDVFYILMEITNPEIKGLSQFIFREFCRELSDYSFINTLGDSGLINLRTVKLSYRPEKIVPAWIAYS